jgi:hypothetical protein
MRNGAVFGGFVILFIGIILLAGTLLQIDLWSYFVPGILIILGIIIILRSDIFRTGR